MRPIDASARACGIGIAASAAPTAGKALAEVKAALARQAGRSAEDWQHIVALFSWDFDADELARGLAEAFPGVPVSGCTTAGGISPLGMMDGGLMVIAFPKDGFRIHSGVIEDVGSSGVERANDLVRRLRAKVKTPASGSFRDHVFGLILVDGLSNAEEPLVAALHWAFEDIQMLGGSAGDGLEFRKTQLIHEGRVLHRAAILLVIESDYQFRIFKTENFEPTQIKLVVTAADAENRIVRELNAEPAALEYASVIGLMPDELGPFSFASYPLVVRVGGESYCRSIRNMNADGSLSFFCAIDEGLVFTLARPTDMIRTTEKILADLDSSLGGLDLVLGFECVLRRLDAETRQIRRPLEELYKRYGVVGFHTYGEQFNSMHLNQTLTGVAFGRRRDAS